MTIPDQLPQGDLRLLDTETARFLLAAPVPAHLAWVGRDGNPRVTPMNAVWTGEELVMGAFAGAFKVADLAARPDVAVSIDVNDGAPQVLLLRGPVTLLEVDGVLPEYVAAGRKVRGSAETDPFVAAIDRPGLRSVRIGLRPTWAGIVDHRSRFAERTPAPVLAALQGKA
ncbi:pyridoxamine 5'-phosphate oxidase family protein [Pseudonocardia cypriaca]|uniref:Pyridoxamine 5'-phosphate oxidase n=1 Tax=Pseudonocardia cypriaca TaxID=882449 RepID=A0A543FRW2_9PSEU|nr:pyridoxamine 5'-phosphate oxidase family protein [Pseudonocardia cypriaca]TQM36583.1 pyridoxamine 5'-phosphate oxidase [Pseudonocardia cypriaca]